MKLATMLQAYDFKRKISLQPDFYDNYSKKCTLIMSFRPQTAI